LEPAQLNGRVWFIGSFRVVGQEPLLDAFDSDASKVGCSGYVFEVLCKLSDELVHRDQDSCSSLMSQYLEGKMLPRFFAD
jgi:hypothetical protein